jgi:isopentenyl-diphosphate delta-isomerase
MLIPIVNKYDRIIGYKDRKDITLDDIYRISSLWLINDNKEFLLSQRALTKKQSPGLWTNAADGTVEKGETYRQNMLKEAKEELGLELKSLKKDKKVEIKNIDGHHHFFAQWFVGYVPKEQNFKIQRSEVEQVKWYTPKTFMIEYQKNPSNFHPILKECVEMFESYLKQ